MSDIDRYLERIADVMGTSWNGRQLLFKVTVEDVPDAKRQLADIRQFQRELRLIKSEVSRDMAEIRQAYSAQVGNVAPGFGASLLFGKGNAKKMAADKKRAMNQQRDRKLAPYDELKRTIDNLLVQLDGLKLKLDRYIQDNK